MKRGVTDSVEHVPAPQRPINRPTKEAVRAWLLQRVRLREPVPEMAQVRRALYS